MKITYNINIMIKKNFIDTIGNTPLIKLKYASEVTECNIYGKAEFLAKEVGSSIKLMKGIKHAFDPKGLLNPGKLFV